MAHRLRSNLTSDESNRLGRIPTHNLAALEAYYKASILQGRDGLGANPSAQTPVADLSLEAIEARFEANDLDWKSTEAMLVAIRLLERAVELDPDFALAHAELAQLYARINPGSGIPKTVREARSDFHLKRALALEPDLGGELGYTLGMSLRANGDSVGAQRAFEKAIALKPSDARNYSDYAVALNVPDNGEGSLTC